MDNKYIKPLNLIQDKSLNLKSNNIVFSEITKHNTTNYSVDVSHKINIIKELTKNQLIEKTLYIVIIECVYIFIYSIILMLKHGIQASFAFYLYKYVITNWTIEIITIEFIIDITIWVITFMFIISAIPLSYSVSNLKINEKLGMFIVNIINFGINIIIIINFIYMVIFNIFRGIINFDCNIRINIDCDRYTRDVSWFIFGVNILLILFHFIFCIFNIFIFFSYIKLKPEYVIEAQSKIANKSINFYEQMSIATSGKNIFKDAQTGSLLEDYN